MAIIDFSFLTDDCRPDNGLLRSRLEDLCNLTGVIVVDANAGGGCGEFGPTSTIDNMTYNPATTELTVDANAGWPSLNIDQFATITFAPLIDFSAVGLYLNGPQLTINYTNPSNCQVAIIDGRVVATEVARYGSASLTATEVRDITAGAPGVVYGDVQREFITAPSNFLMLDEQSLVYPFHFTVLPSASFTITLQTAMQTFSATTAQSVNEWIQSNLSITAQVTLT